MKELSNINIKKKKIKEIYNLKSQDDIEELQILNKLDVLIIGEQLNISMYNFDKLVCDYKKLINTNIKEHFLIKIKCFNWSNKLNNNNIIDKNILNNLKLPKEIKKIISYDYLIDIFDDKIITQLNKLEELYIINNNFNKKLINQPQTLKIISIISKEFNQSISNLPLNLKYLYINSNSFNQNLDNLPINLKVLSISSKRIICDLKNLPTNLKILHLNISNGISTTIEYLPESIKCLYLSASYIESTLSNLPVGIDILYINTNELEDIILRRYNISNKNIKQKYIKSNY